jgi:hypothetical protein
MTRALNLLVDHLTAAIVTRVERLKAWLIAHHARAVRAHVRHAGAQSTNPGTGRPRPDSVPSTGATKPGTK